MEVKNIKKMNKKTAKNPKMTREQEIKETLKAISDFEKEKKAGKLMRLKNVSELFDDNDN